MMYSFMTLNDNTEIVHSNVLSDGRVKVYFERPDEEKCFCNATCYLPDYQWCDINGFSQEEINYFQEILETTAHLIIVYAREGGFENASGF